jgi:16S rRNA G1207 methylase RsmC
MGNLSVVVRQLKKERTRLADELHRVTAALTAFGKVYISGSNPNAAANHTKRTLSAAARKKISLAQKKRWAAGRKEWKPAAAEAPAKRSMSASARRKIAAAQRKRWAKMRAGKKKAA